MGPIARSVLDVGMMLDTLQHNTTKDPLTLSVKHQTFFDQLSTCENASFIKRNDSSEVIVNYKDENNKECHHTIGMPEFVKTQLMRE